ncbi:DUF1365 domain-containing protein [Polynucleobacter kasalickyi]|uniref:DUF1365 domain-containing protein n=1 Tax=Polynucleobacter kasalickyi TaxID=1938817 RepID=A0A1W2AT62_9BURK|nr:DUF1365 domain-containing protein [Polynucleobacter kasalickyi]SMC63875.1 hypothetical protein SAMN06296008_11075 [Polynucleobacter kasalickyi]
MAQASFHFGRVIHHRYQPNNRFSYRVFYLRIPMRSRKQDPKLLSNVGIGDNKFSIFSFYDKDHGLNNQTSLHWVEQLLSDHQIEKANGEIWLHTFPRFFGYVFNPVSFWFCHDDKNNLVAIVAEVNNTFGDRHAYLLHDHQDNLPWGKTLHTDKLFYVSPFFDVKGRYQFRFMRQELEHQARHVSRIEYFDQEDCVLMTSISGQESPITFASKLNAFFNYPLLTFGVIVKIHFQAIKLLVKGAKFYKKPATTTT